jgi:hypothetical protein
LSHPGSPSPCLPIVLCQHTWDMMVRAITLTAYVRLSLRRCHSVLLKPPSTWRIPVHSAFPNASQRYS